MQTQANARALTGADTLPADLWDNVQNLDASAEAIVDRIMATVDELGNQLEATLKLVQAELGLPALDVDKGRCIHDGSGWCSFCAEAGF